MSSSLTVLVQEHIQFHWEMLRVGGVDRLFQAKFLDRTEQGYMLELGFKKISQSTKVVFIYQVTIAWNLKLSLS